jgi:hypothetical protein
VRSGRRGGGLGGRMEGVIDMIDYMMFLGCVILLLWVDCFDILLCIIGWLGASLRVFCTSIISSLFPCARHIKGI